MNIVATTHKTVRKQDEEDFFIAQYNLSKNVELVMLWLKERNKQNVMYQLVGFNIKISTNNIPT